MKFFDMPDVDGAESLNDFYKRLLDQVPDVIFKLIWKEKNRYVLTFCSESVKHIYEVSVAEMRTKPAEVLNARVLPQYRRPFYAELNRARRLIIPWMYEYEVLLPNKGKRWMKVHANPELQTDGSVVFYGRMSDITPQKEQQLLLKHSEERIKYALEAASEGIWDYDIVNNTIFFSAQSMKIIGKEEKDTVWPLEEWKKRIYKEDLRGHNKATDDYFKNKTPRFEYIYRVKNETTGFRWVMSRGSFVDGVNGKDKTRAIGTIKDITELKEKEIELARTITIIGEQNNRLSNFAHIVSHNLRSHAGNLKMLLDLFKTAEENEREEMLGHLEGISDGLSITIGHLKELVAIQTEVKNVKEDLNLRRYLKNILTILHNEIIKHGVTIEINIPLDVTVNYNPAYLESVLLNFTTNAIKYSSSEREPVINYDFAIEKGKKVLYISDNGLGIDLKKHKNALFGMYKTFHKNKNSRGIGLFITKNQVEAMGGKIEVASEINKGTVFKLYFNEES
ncbi:ATP-binding protein [Flavobacterium sp. RHBU_24]|uniref:PAS domain-containing sensor histidine kinase n=1 Tax=Flavobacterium sp. RHBU_24 TaxID=3391185 RepID=UPI0039854F25